LLAAKGISHQASGTDRLVLGWLADNSNLSSMILPLQPVFYSFLHRFGASLRKMTTRAAHLKDPPVSESDTALPVRETRWPWLKIVWLAALMALLLIIVYVSPLREHVGKAQEWKAWVRGLGWWAPVAVGALVAVLVGIGVPRLGLCVIAGMTLGFWWGLISAQVGTLLGNYALFLLARASGGDWVRRYLAKRKKLSGLIHNGGIAGVILARQLPVPGLIINLALGLMTIRHLDFLLGTIVGQLPQAIPCTLIGAGILKASFAKSATYIGLGAALAVLIWIGLKHWLKKPPSGA
jgi:uncharacterized membrane protein YdjX (TVP38/TMEM64 family)